MTFELAEKSIVERIIELAKTANPVELSYLCNSFEAISRAKRPDPSESMATALTASFAKMRQEREKEDDKRRNGND